MSEIGQIKKAVVGLLFNERRTHVALLLKTHPAPLAGFWNGPGGVIEEGETPLEAMTREFQEETGVFVEGWELFLEWRPPGKNIFFYRAFGSHENLKTQKGKAGNAPEKVDTFHVDCLIGTVLFSELNWQIPMALSRNIVVPVVIETKSDPLQKKK